MFQFFQVEAFNDEKDKKAREGLQDTDSVIAITKPSKLNPNVPEFKPRGFTSPSHSRYRNNYKKSPAKHKSNCSSNKDSNVVVQNVDVKTKEIQMQDEIKGKQIIHADENEYATTLKKQISDAAKSNSHEVKKQKNVAIATLLSLYANKDTEAGSTAPLKLMKPEYFEGKVEIPAEKAQKPLETISTVTSSTPEPKLTSTTLGTNSTLNVSASTSCGSPKTKLDPETKKSIFKVNKWLGEPTERKSPAPYLGPIEFKRKERKIICKSPSSDSALRPPKPDVQSQKYQPSQYAADLQKRYKERQKALESKQKEITWDNLEEVLKQKDLAMKKRLEQAEQEPALTSDT